MQPSERWQHLCEVLCTAAPGLDAVGAHDREGNVLALVNPSQIPGDRVAAIRAVAERLGSSSPLLRRRVEAQPRATFTVGGRRLLLRSLAGNTGYVFIFGAPDHVSSNTWLLLDAVAVLGGALQSQSRSDESQEKS